MSEHYVVISGDQYILYNEQNLKYLSRNAIAAKVTLSPNDFARLENMSDEEFQDWLRHYFEAGQKVVVDGNDTP